MLTRDYPTQTCSVARSLEIVGERWSLLILRSVFLGTTRFEALCNELGIARNILDTRLRHLVKEGVLDRVAYQDRPSRYEYRVTVKGRELFPVIMHLLQWGDAHYPAPNGPPRVAEHTNCGGHPDDHLLCERCREPLTQLNTTLRPGPMLAAAA